MTFILHHLEISLNRLPSFREQLILMCLLLPLSAKGQTDTLSTKEPETTMREMTVKASKILMVQNGDTLVYNADLLQLSVGAMLDELINALPEARISPDGGISVKGEPVAELLIEGRDFFHGDPTIALKNMPSFTVKKVKVYRRVPRNAYLTREDKGKKARETDPLVMDVRLKPQYQNGIIANVESASGVPTQGESKYLYLERLFGLHYNERRSLSGYAGLNNVNDKGKPRSKGMWSDQTDEMGEQRHTIAGLDYTYERPENRLKISSSLKFADSKDIQESESSSMRYLTDGQLHSLSTAQTDRRSLSLSWNGSCFYPARAFTLELQPRLTLSKAKSQSSQRSATFSDLLDESLHELVDSINGLTTDAFMSCPNAINRQAQQSENNMNGVDLGLIARSTIKPASFKRPLNLSLMGNFWSNATKENQENNIDYTAATSPSYRKRQYTRNPISQGTLIVDLNYNAWSFIKGEKTGRVDLSFKSDLRHESRERRLYNLDELMEAYAWGAWGELPDEAILQSVLDPKNSYQKLTAEYNQPLNARGTYNFSKNFGCSLSLPLMLKNRRLRDERPVSHVDLSKSNVLVSPSVSLQLWRISLGYSYSTLLPELESLADRTDDSNPMLISIGNKDLRNGHVHHPSINYSHRYDKAHAFASLRVDCLLKQHVVKRMFYNNAATGVTTAQNRNVDGDWQADVSGRFQKDFGRQRQWQFVTDANLTLENSNEYDRSASDGEAILCAAKRLGLYGNAELTYSHEGWLVSLHVKYNWRQTRSMQQRFTDLNYINLRYGAAVRTPVWHGLSLTTTFNVTTDRGLVNKALNRSYLIWNADARYDLNGHWSFQFEGIDLLRQLTSVSMGGSATGWSESRRNTRPSYILAHAVYRFNLLPKNRK